MIQEVSAAKSLEFKNPTVDFEIFELSDPDLKARMAAGTQRDKLSVLSFSGPFEIICRRDGRLNFLKEIARNPEGSANALFRESEELINSIKNTLEENAFFDSAWIWSDLAHKTNLFFPYTYYEKYLFPIHKKLISFLKSRNMPVIFHSDGKIDNLVPYLVEAGISALHPLDEYADMDIEKLKKEYTGRLVFFG